MHTESQPYELCAYPNPYSHLYNNNSSSSSSSRIASFWEQVCRSARSWKKSARKRWLDVRHSKRQQRRLLKHMEVFYAVILLLVLLLFLYYMFWGETEADQALLFRFVSIRESRMDIHLRSEELTCEHITGGLALPGFEAQLLFTELMKTAGVRLLKQRPSMACNCAPLYNFPFRYITLPPSKEVAHLFNPVVVGSLPELGKSLVTESQELLIPGAGTRNMTRLNGIQLSFHDEWCQLKQLSLTYSTAWCIQSCIDLLNGKTIYEG